MCTQLHFERVEWTKLVLSSLRSSKSLIKSSSSINPVAQFKGNRSQVQPSNSPVQPSLYDHPHHSSSIYRTYHHKPALNPHIYHIISFPPLRLLHSILPPSQNGTALLTWPPASTGTANILIQDQSAHILSLSHLISYLYLIYIYININIPLPRIRQTAST